MEREAIEEVAQKESWRSFLIFLLALVVNAVCWLQMNAICMKSGHQCFFLFFFFFFYFGESRNEIVFLG